jgi:redox-sensing transcriptional repressor
LFSRKWQQPELSAAAAQGVTGTLVRAGIWNFTNVKLKIPGTVTVQREDRSSGYAMLSVMLTAKAYCRQKL